MRVVTTISIVLLCWVYPQVQSHDAELIARGVSAGAVTLAPMEIRSLARHGFAIATQNRVLSFIDPIGGDEIFVPIGFQADFGAFRREPAVFALFDDRLRMARIDLNEQRGVEVRTRFQRVPEWVVGDTNGFPRAHLDGAGNFFLLSDYGTIVHLSSAGNVLWARALPAEPIDTASSSGVWYVALENGLVMRFDAEGVGESVTQISDTPTSIAADPSGESMFVSDRRGRLGRYRIVSDRAAIAWERSFDRPVNILHVTEDVLLVGADGLRVAIARNGAELWRYETENDLVGGMIVDRSTAVFVDSANRLITYGSAGVSATIELGDSIDAIDPFPALGLLLVRFADWRWEVYRLGESTEESVGTSVAILPPRPTTPLSRIAQLAVEGASGRDRRRFLEIVEDRLDRQALYGDVGTVRRGAVALLEEVSRVSSGVDDPEVRRRAVAILGSLLDDHSRSALTRAIRDDPDIGVVAAAIGVIANWGIPDPLVTAATIRRFERANRRERAVLAPAIVVMLESYRGTRRADVRSLAQAVASSDVSRESRRRAVEAMR